MLLCFAGCFYLVMIYFSIYLLYWRQKQNGCIVFLPFIIRCCHSKLYFLMLQVHADGTKIRRSVSKPLAEMSKEHQDSLKLRFVYAVSFFAVLFSAE